MKARCKIDYGQFETNKKYDYSYQNQTRKYHVDGQYGKTEFTKRQFDVMFVPDNNIKNERNVY